MPEYIYLLEHRLTEAQQHALRQVRDAAREAGTTVFLTGGAVRDLTTGSSVRNLDFTVQGNALALESAVVARGGALWGTHEPTRTLTFWFPGSVRVSVASARTEQYPKPGKPVYTWSSIVDDLRRRDFTANAMALSLNEGSYGLLLDPLNGVADIEARLLRLASNYGFLEEPSRLVRATRLLLRLGWQMDEKTATRYANAKEAESIKAVSPYLRGYELEKIASEEDALQTLKALEAEGWMEHLFAAWTSAQADVAGLENLRRNWIQLLMQGVTADLTAAHLELLTAKLGAKDREALKKAMVHPGLIRQWEGLEESAKEFGRQLTSKTAATPSATWKLLTTHAAEPILWLASTRKTGAAAGAVDAKFKNFFTVWPEFKKKVPTALMLEMRITPELPGYEQLLEQMFFQLIDGNLETEEQLRAFLEPYSPPAPPPPPTLRRSRAKKSESKTKRRTAAPEDEDEDEDSDDPDADETAAADDEDEEEVEEVEEADDPVLVSSLRKLDLEIDEPEEAEDDDEDDEAGSVAATPSAAGKGAGGNRNGARVEAEAPTAVRGAGHAVDAVASAAAVTTAAPAPPAAETPASPTADATLAVMAGEPAAPVKAAAKAPGKTPGKVAGTPFKEGKPAPAAAGKLPVSETPPVVEAKSEPVHSRAVAAKAATLAKALAPAKATTKAAPVKAIAEKVTQAKAVPPVKAAPVKAVAAKAVAAPPPAPARKAAPAPAPAKKPALPAAAPAPARKAAAKPTAAPPPALAKGKKAVSAKAARKR